MGETNAEVRMMNDDFEL